MSYDSGGCRSVISRELPTIELETGNLLIWGPSVLHVGH
jgi:hypothetical protein